MEGGAQIASLRGRGTGCITARDGGRGTGCITARDHSRNSEACDCPVSVVL